MHARLHIQVGSLSGVLADHRYVLVRMMMLYCMCQGAIYDLHDPDGKDCGKLLKVLKFKAALPITGNDIGGSHFIW